MSASATDARRPLLGYGAAVLLSALFGGVYEVFSHGVWSFCMVYAFLFPLALGVLPCAAELALDGARPGIWARRLHRAGVATLTVGSHVQGILTIYGTTNALTMVYWAAGPLLLLAGLLARILRK